MARNLNINSLNLKFNFNVKIMTKSGMKCLIRALFRSVQITVGQFRNNLAKNYPTVKKYGQKSSQNFWRLSNNRYWSRNFQGPFSEKNYLGFSFDCTVFSLCELFILFEFIVTLGVLKRSQSVWFYVFDRFCNEQ